MSEPVSNADELQQEITSLRAENAALKTEVAQRTAERDEARRWVCELWEKTLPATSGMTAGDYAAECGWDCFEVQP